MKFELDITSCMGYAPELEDIKKFLSKEFLDKLSKEGDTFFIEINTIEELVGMINDIKKTYDKGVDDIIVHPSWHEKPNQFTIEIYDTYRE